MSGGHAESLPLDWQVSSEQTENFMAQVAMVVVAGPHICSFVCLACCRSSHGIFCAVGSSIAVEAVLLWWFLSHPGTSVRIALQTLGLGLAGAWLFLRTLWVHARTASSSQQVGMGGSLGGGSGGIIDGGVSANTRKEEGLRIIGAEQWLLAWRFLTLSRRIVRTAVASSDPADISHDLNALPLPLFPQSSFLTPSLLTYNFSHNNSSTRLVLAPPPPLHTHVCAQHVKLDGTIVRLAVCFCSSAAGRRFSARHICVLFVIRFTVSPDMGRRRRHVPLWDCSSTAARGLQQ